ncbi:MAG: AbrB/MazE/SpoVT family DNA-binding domain-containing protein [Terracidiphilus sp.]
MYAYATIGPDGQITIPAKVREDLGLKAGDRLWFFKGENGEYILKVKTGSIQDVKGMWKWTGKPATIEEMNETIAKGWAGLLTFED